MKYGVLALLLIGLIPGCTCGRKDTAKKTDKKMKSRKKPAKRPEMTRQRAMNIQNEMLEADMMDPGMQM